MAACPDSWISKPFGAVTPIPYRATFDRTEYRRLAEGLVPNDMDDKWFVYLDRATLSFHRSWTGQAVYRIDLLEADGGASVCAACCADEVLATGSATYQAALLHFLVANLLLDRSEPFPLPPGSDDASGVLQHHLAGTGYPRRGNDGSSSTLLARIVASLRHQVRRLNG